MLITTPNLSGGYNALENGSYALKSLKSPYQLKYRFFVCDSDWFSSTRSREKGKRHLCSHVSLLYESW